jgi:hypothetical protein
MWSRPSLVPQRFRPQDATPSTPLRQPEASRAHSLVETRCGPNVMGPYGPIDPETRGILKGKGRTVGVPHDFGRREKGKHGPTTDFDPVWRKGAPKGQEPAVQDWSRYQPTTGEGAQTALERARSQGKGIPPELPACGSHPRTLFLRREPSPPTSRSLSTSIPATTYQDRQRK